MASINQNRFRKALRNSGLDQTALSKKVGCTPGAINQIASGQTKKSRLLPEISRELGVSMDWLLNLSDDPQYEGGKGYLTRQENDLVDLWRDLDRQTRDALTLIIAKLGGTSSTVHEPGAAYKAQDKAHHAG